MLAIIALLSVSHLAAAIDIWPDKPEDESTPIGIRLGLGSATSMNVGWSTYAEPEDQVCVLYSTDPDNLSSRACSNNVRTYGTSRVWYSQVELTGLQPAQKYYYQIEANTTTTNSFTMTRAPGDTTPYSVAALADLGYHSDAGISIFDSHPTVGMWNQMKDQFDLTLFPGDYAYADDYYLNLGDLVASFTGQDAYQALLEHFFNLVEPITSSQPFMITAGNHEATCIEIPYLNGLCPYSQTNFTDIRVRFDKMFPTGFTTQSTDPTAISNSERARQLANPPFWYSFESGMVHYVFIDTETDFENAPDEPGASSGLNGGPFGFPGQQLQWLEADLASVDRKITPWIVVNGHRPWYAASSSICASCQSAFEETLYHYGVDLVVTGHVHNSQRFGSIYNGTVDFEGYASPQAPMYIVVGGAGNAEGLDPIDFFNLPDGYMWGDGISSAFAILDIQSRTNLGVRFIDSYFGMELDSATLIKDHDQQFVRQ